MKNRFILAILFCLFLLNQNSVLTAAAADSAECSNREIVDVFLKDLTGGASLKDNMKRLNELATLLLIQDDVFMASANESEAYSRFVDVSRNLFDIMGAENPFLADKPLCCSKKFSLKTTESTCIIFKYSNLFTADEIGESHREEIKGLCLSEDSCIREIGEVLRLKLEASRTSLASRTIYHKTSSLCYMVVNFLVKFYKFIIKEELPCFEFIGLLKARIGDDISAQLACLFDIIDLYTRNSNRINLAKKTKTFVGAITEENIAFEQRKAALLNSYSESRDRLAGLYEATVAEIHRLFVLCVRGKRDLFKYKNRFDNGNVFAPKLYVEEVVESVENVVAKTKRVRRKGKKRRRNKKGNGYSKGSPSVAEEECSACHSHDAVCSEELLDPVEIVCAAESADVVGAAEAPPVQMRCRPAALVYASRVKRWFNTGVTSETAPFVGYVLERWEDEIFRHGISRAIDMFVGELAIIDERERILADGSTVVDKIFTIPFEVVFRDDSRGVECFTITYVMDGGGMVYHRRIDQGPFSRQVLVKNYFAGILGRNEIEDESGEEEDFEVVTRPEVHDNVYYSEYYYKIVPGDSRFSSVREIRLYKYRDAGSVPAAACAPAACAAAAACAASACSR